MNTDIAITQNYIENLIFTVRNIEVILDYHLQNYIMLKLNELTNR